MYITVIQEVLFNFYSGLNFLEFSVEDTIKDVASLIPKTLEILVSIFFQNVAPAQQGSVRRQ